MIRWCNLEKRDIAGRPCAFGEYEGCEKILVDKKQGKFRCPHLQYKERAPELNIPF